MTVLAWIGLVWVVLMGVTVGLVVLAWMLGALRPRRHTPVTEQEIRQWARIAHPWIPEGLGPLILRRRPSDVVRFEHLDSSARQALVELGMAP